MQKDDIRLAVHETLTALGFDINEPREAQADMIYLRKIRTGSEEISSKIKIAISLTMISTGLYLIVQGIKSALPDFVTSLPKPWQ